MNSQLLALTFAGAIVLAAAPDDTSRQEISTDRPDFTESTDTVARGSLQLESGLLLSRHAMEGGPSNYFGGPFPLLRVGLSRFAEFRLGSDGVGRESELVEGGRQYHAGLSDLDAGVKVRFWDERKYIPAFAVIGELSIPVGATYFTSGHIDPEVELCWSKSLSHDIDLGGNVNFKRLMASATTEKAVSLTAGKKLRRGFGVFGEIYRISPIEGDELAHWIVDTGLTKLFGPNAQIDLMVGHTINANTPYSFVGLGFSFRIPNSNLFHPLAHRQSKPQGQS